MILLTGAAGFIGSCMLSELLAHQYKEIVLIDDFSRPEKNLNWASRSHLTRIDRRHFLLFLDQYKEAKAVIHLGARTDTTETNAAIFDELNLHYSQAVWDFCTRHQIPLFYASSAATYGAGEQGYDDSHDIVSHLKPLNLYGKSKNDFDFWALQQPKTPPHWYGFKFFNVFGPNEYHKKRMASVVWHGYQQIQQKGTIQLFRSHRPDYEDGKQLRDFVYVKDVVQIIRFFMENLPPSGLYNLGTGQTNTFLHLAESVFAALELPPNIIFVDMPEDLRNNYQYFTQANIAKLQNVAAYNATFYSLSTAIRDYVQNYLLPQKYYW
ncbi:MAG: ADP-glyceromanno-heptose 6-epimerase [Chitinophagales bacterium]|nr:ADP-glyceromanno-heptose 6-epimerase [Chitinophagales bacterium]